MLFVGGLDELAEAAIALDDEALVQGFGGDPGEVELARWPPVWACGKTNSNPADARNLTDNANTSGSGGSVGSTDALGSAGVASDASDTRDETDAQAQPTSDAIDLTPDSAASDSVTADLHSDLALVLDTRDAWPRDPMPGLDASDASISVDSPSARNDGASMDSPEDDAMAEVGSALPCADPQACTDFPAAPILDLMGPTALPADPGSSFTIAPSGAGPCVTEPEDGSLFPYNWTRPRIKWTGTSGLAQINIHADIEDHDLVVYTTANAWVMDAAIWKGLAASHRRHPFRRGSPP